MSYIIQTREAAAEWNHASASIFGWSAAVDLAKQTAATADSDVRLIDSITGQVLWTQDRQPKSELIDAAGSATQPTKIVGLTGLNVRALRETFPGAIEEGDLVLTATTATWTRASAGMALTILSETMDRMPTRNSWKQSLHAVRRKLAKAAAESPEGQAQKQRILEKLGLAQAEQDLDALPGLEAQAESAGHQYGADDDTAGRDDHSLAARRENPRYVIVELFDGADAQAIAREIVGNLSDVIEAQPAYQDGFGHYVPSGVAVA